MSVRSAVQHDLKHRASHSLLQHLADPWYHEMPQNRMGHKMTKQTLAVKLVLLALNGSESVLRLWRVGRNSLVTADP